MAVAGYALVALIVSQTAWSATFTVNKVADSGPGSLREAILGANLGVGPDTIVFAPGLSGDTISPLTPLPDIASGTTIDGDIDGNNAPDVRLRGALLATGSGLHIIGSGCRIYGLAIVAFPHYGIRASSVTDTVIQKCHVGVDLAGSAAGYNQLGQLLLEGCDGSIVGGAGTLRNVIAGGQGIGQFGIILTGGDENAIAGNYVGLTRDGAGDLGGVGDGISVVATPTTPGAHNYIGSPSGGLKNALGGLGTGINVIDAEGAIIRNNLIGLTGNGDVLAPISYVGIDVGSSCGDLTIGGTSPADRNVFAGGAIGIQFRFPTPMARVLGNWFGTNGAGTETRHLRQGVFVGGTATAVAIGGASPAAGNYFTPNSPGVSPVGCYLIGDPGTSVRNNHFGVLPNGQTVTLHGGGVSVQSLVYVLDNDFARCDAGIYNAGADADGRVFGNRFRNCYVGVWRTGGKLLLGNLSNANANDDGGNTFKSSNTYHIRNDVADGLRAEGNSFDSTLKADIDAKIRDRLDDPSLGRVDFTPLAGGVTPTGNTEGRLALGAASALPTAAGAEIAFSLSAPAEVSVEVLNLAGRTIAHPVAGRELPAGLTRLSWSGLADTGTAAPAGQYLVRIRARSASGGEASALASLGLRR